MLFAKFSLFAILCVGLAYSCENGAYSPHPTDCSKYLICSNGAQIEGSCNTGLHWNAKGKYCDYPANAGCTSGGGGGGGSTTSTPQTTTRAQTTTQSGGGGDGGMIGRTRTGVCSWYGREDEIPPGWPTSCGQPFDRFAMAAATWPDVPCGSRLRVTDMDTGKTVEVTVDDRFGGAPSERIVDLTYGAFAHLANHDQGLIKNCRYEIIG